jgi:hypothetical protein
MLLPSMVHHYNWMLVVLEKDPSHPFGEIPLLSSHLFQVLKKYHLIFEINTHVPALI